MKNVIHSFNRLRSYCEKENFKGYDPYDGLNSTVFQAIPFAKKSAICRLIMIQTFKRCPVNLRKLFLVPKGYNAKGIGLFLQGYCNLWQLINTKPELEKKLGSKEEIYCRIIELADLLLTLQSQGYSGSCWGYNFDWQSKAFFLPKYTPTVVATSFVVESLLSAYEITKNGQYINTAFSSANFILNDLNRIEKERGFMFSYSPLDNRAVYNASLLGSKTLSLFYKYTLENEYKRIAKITTGAVINIQNEDGSFPHSDQVGNTWRDNFHTGFKLESIRTYIECCKDNQFEKPLEKGFNYWIDNFFDNKTGLCYYYDRGMSDTIDMHCAAQAITTIYKLGKFQQYENLIDKMVSWGLNNMFDTKKGYFYFQMQGKKKNKIKYIRWSNAWMFYALSYYLKGKYNG
ncbi:MAG: delta-aminolevulinic acid dehydratase [Bacteroidales bacterium]|jgi:hypothetical protein|nr:delta-aminolevulinic acid dehydratase [Bacteroidales bacterium]